MSLGSITPLARLALLPAALGILPLAAAAQPLVIDDLQTAQNETAAAGAASSSTVTAGGNVIEGGSRDLLVQRGTGTGNTTADVTGGVLSFTSDAGAEGSARLGWDGDADGDPAAIDPGGLDGADLTNGGTDTALLFTLNQATAGTELEVEVFTDGANSSIFRRSLPEVTAATVFNLPYSSFVPNLGATGADFASVGAVSLLLRGTGVTATLLGPIQTAGAAPVISAVKRDLDPGTGLELGPTELSPGDTIRYEITISNTGGTAQNVVLEDLLESLGNDNLRHLGDPNGQVSSTPLAFSDQYTHCGNTTLAVDGSPGFEGLLDNDGDPDNDSITLVSINGDTNLPGPITTDQGGSITLAAAASGQFTYDPPAGFTGTDSFDYTITDDDGNLVGGSATILIDELVWFVQDDHGGTNQGTLANPFTDFAALDGTGGTGDSDEPGHTIFLFEGSGTLADGIELEDGQSLIGHGVGLATCVPGGIAAAGRPLLAPASVEHAITLASGNTIRGLDIGSTDPGRFALKDNGSTIGTATVSELSISGTGGLLDLRNGGTADFTFDSLATTNASGGGIFLDGIGGTLAVSGTTSINNATFNGITITGSPGSDSFSFGGTTVNATGSGVTITSSSGAAFTFDSLSITTTGGGTGLFTNTAGTLNIGGTTNTIDATGGQAADIVSTTLSNGAGAGVTFADVSSSGSPGFGIRLLNVSGDFTATGGTIAGSTDEGLRIDGGSDAVTVAQSISKTSAGELVRIETRTGGTVTVSGNLSATGASGGIALDGNANAAITFSGLAKTLATGANAGVTLTNNTNSTIDFTGGGLDIDTTTGTGFSATGGGTLQVTGTGNTITTVESGPGLGDAASAVVMNGISIGALDVTFASISASDTADVPAIDIDNVSNAGTFNAANVIAQACGGTAAGIDIRDSSAIFNFTSVDIDATGGAGINLSNNSGAVTVSGGDVTGAGGAAVDVAQGAAAVTYSGTINNSANRSVEVTGRTGGTVTLNGTIGDTGTGIFLDGNASGAPTIDFNGQVTTNTAGSTAVTASGNVGATIRFDGGLDVDTSIAAGMDLSGGGTVHVAGGTNTVNTSTGGTGVLLNGIDLALAGGGLGVNTGTGIGVSVTGGVVDISGGSLDIDTTTGTGFTAAGGGTVSVQGGSNTIASTAGTAVTLNGVTIGGSGMTFASISSTNAGGGDDGLSFTSVGGGTFSVTGTTSVQPGGGSFDDGIDITTSGATFTFSFLDIDDPTDAGLSLTNNTGGVTATGGDITGAGGAAVDVAQGNAAVTYSGTINNAAGRSVEVTARTGGTVTFNGTISDTGTGIFLDANASGTPTIDFNGTVTTSTGAVTAVTASGNTGATIRFDGGLDVDTSTAAGMSLTAGGTVHVTGGTNTVDTSTGGTGVVLNGIDLALAGGGLDVTSSAGSGIGVSATGNSVNISGGGLDIVSGGGTGFQATAGGTVTVTGTGNTISTTTGRGVDISSTTIGTVGAGPPTDFGVTFESISVNGASRGIRLNGVGTGGLLVTGDGSMTGGVLDRDGSGGTLQSTTDDGVELIAATNVTLRQMNILGVGNSANSGDTNTATNDHGVESRGGGNIVLSAVHIQDPIGTGWEAFDITGVNRVDNDSLIEELDRTSNFPGFRVRNTNTSFTSITLDDVTFDHADPTPGDAATNGNAMVVLSTRGSSSGAWTVNNSTFTGARGQAMTLGVGDTAGSTGTVTTSISNSTFEVSHGTNGQNNLGITALELTTHNVTVSGNTFRDVGRGLSNSGQIIVQKDDAAVLDALISGNTIHQIVAQRGIEVLSLSTSSGGRVDAEVTGNTIYDVGREGVFVSARGSEPDMDVLVMSNIIGRNGPGGPISAVGDQNGGAGILIDAQASSNLAVKVDSNEVIARPDTFGACGGSNCGVLTVNVENFPSGSALVNATVENNTLNNDNTGGTNLLARARDCGLTLNIDLGGAGAGPGGPPAGGSGDGNANHATGFTTSYNILDDSFGCGGSAPTVAVENLANVTNDNTPTGNVTTTGTVTFVGNVPMPDF